MLHIPGLYVADTEGRGRGVFTSIDLSKGDIIEFCPLIIIPPDQKELIHKTILHDYYFEWPEPAGAVCLPLGYGCIYNHSKTPNIEIVLDIEGKTMQFHCLKTTEAGSELLFDYTGGEEEELWFETV